MGRLRFPRSACMQASADAPAAAAGWQRHDDSPDEAELRTLLHKWGLRRRDDIIIDLMGISSVAELSHYACDEEGFVRALASCGWLLLASRPSHG